MFDYKDFVPAVLEPGGMMRAAKYAPVETAVAEAREWIRGAGVEVLNVETLLLPRADSPGDTVQDASGEVYRSRQVIRVWYSVPH